MESRKITNILLLVIAICLLLIVGNIYEIGLISQAQAQWMGKSLSSSELIPVAIHAKNSNGSWYPCQINNGDKLIVEVINLDEIDIGN